ncbi:MAG: amidohydrolase [Candidatus Bathyarchaeota archaeon]|nr:amidohydrolase [Candidatus Bathyarchaeota archaeon]
MRKLALIHGNVITMDESNPRAQAVFVLGDKILNVGSDAEIEVLVDDDTTVIDLEGKTLVSGFIDCHAHPMGYGQSLMAVNCATPPVASIKEMIERIGEATEGKTDGEWILGRGYDDFKLAERRHPNKWDLDEAAPRNPVMITRLCGHISAVNSLALEMAGISKDTPVPEGGRIDRDPETGKPTGVLRGGARQALRELIPPPTIGQLRKGINLAAEKFLARGVTSVSDAGVGSPLNTRAYQAAIREDRMPLRVNLMMSSEVLNELVSLGIKTGFGDGRLKIGAIKIVFDGSSSGRTAALSEPYEDVSDSTGILYLSQEELNQRVLAAHKAGFQVGVHAIGDRAIIGVLDAFEAALKELPREDHRLRIEHCGINSPMIVGRIKEIGVVPVPQPIFLYGEGESYRAGLGEERVRWAYPMRSWMDAGIKVPMSSDCPATSGEELISPLLGIYVAVTRKTDAGVELGPEQRIGVDKALKAYTLNSAYATFEEGVKGSIELGKLADFAVLSDDPTAAPSDSIKDIAVDMTIIGGMVVYKRPG